MQNQQSIGRTTRVVRMAGLLAGALLLPGLAGAQSGNGFLFGAPHVKFSLRGGFAQPSASSDIFSFTSSQLTMGKRDFAGAAFAADLSIRLTERFELQLSGGSTSRSVKTEFRDWVDNDDLPIEQTTSFKRIPMTAGVKYNLTSPGRSVGSLAWIPARWTPYVGVGGGVMYYKFKQIGDWVDYKTLDVYPETMESESIGAAGYANLGIDYTLTPRIGLVSEVRYDYARGSMSNDFRDFNRIDLSGASATIGFNLRF